MNWRSTRERLLTSVRRRKFSGPLATSFVWSFGGGFASKAAVLVTSLAAVRSLDPVDFGVYIGMSATALLAAFFWDFGLSTLLTRGFATDGLSLHDAILESVRYRLKTLPLWAISFLAGTWILSRNESISFATILGFAGNSFFLSGVLPLLALQRARLKFRAAETSIAIGRWLTALLSIMVLRSGGHFKGIEFLTLAVVIGDAVTFVIASINSRKLRGIKGDGTKVSISVRDGMPFATNAFLIMAYNRFDVLILSAMSSAQQLALYAPASRIQDALYLLPGSLGLIAIPMMSRASRSEHKTVEVDRLIKRFVTIGLALSLPIALVFYIFTPEIIRVLIGARYEGAVTTTRILIWFLPCAAISTPLIAALVGIGNAADTTRVFFATFCTALLAHCSLDWWLGATGGAIASLSREPVAIIVAWWLVRQAGLLRNSADASIPANINAAANLSS